MIGLALVVASTGAYANTDDMAPTPTAGSSSANSLLKTGEQVGAMMPTASPSPLANNNPSPFKSIQPFNKQKTDKSPQTRDSSSYTLTFDSDGGSKVSDQSVTSGKLASPPTVTKAGFLFDGWFVKAADGSSNVAYDFSKPVTGPLNLKAHWSSVNDAQWTTTNVSGDDTGGSAITLTPPKPRSVRFTQASTGRYHTLAVGSDGHVYAWGNQASGGLGNSKDSGQVATPVRITENDAIKGKIFIAVSAGDAYSMALASDGTVYTWGSNGKGQLGNGTTTDSAVPVKANLNATITAISAGRSYAMALASDGTVYTWGNNEQGQLGIGSSDKNPHSSPAKVPTLSGITAIGAGFTTGTALDSQGHAWAWGKNDVGQLGNGTLDNNPTPTRVQDLNTGQPDTRSYIAISAGYQHVLALDTDHDVYGWGSGTKGSTKISFGTDGVNITAISAGDDGSEAIDDSGSIYTWGNEGYGQLGNGNYGGTTANAPWQTSPAAITLAQSVKACAVATSGHHQTAIGSDGLLYTWGYNYYNQIGRNGKASVPGTTQPPQITLTKVTFGKTDVVKTDSNSPISRTSAGDDTWSANTPWTVTTPYHTYGTTKIKISEWAIGGVAQQGQDIADYTFTPTAQKVTFDSDGGSSVSDQSVTSGKLASPPTVTKAGFLFDGWFVKAADGSSNVAYDFSKPVTGPLNLKAHWSSPDTKWKTTDPLHGDDTGGSAITLTPPKPRSVRFTQASTGRYHTLAVGSDGHVYAWGNQASGGLGNSKDSGQVATPVRITENDAIKGKIFIAVSAGDAYSMALASDGTVYTWGSNGKGQLGNGTTTDSAVPVKANLNATITAISAGRSYAMALASDGTVYTWGNNEQGQLGIGSSDKNPHSSPAKVPTLSGITAIGAGFTTGTALDSQGHAWAWGENSKGQLGNGTLDGNPTPTRVQDLNTGQPDTRFYIAISAGYQHVLALDTDHDVYGWGSSAAIGSSTDTNASTKGSTKTSFGTDGVNITAISAGDDGSEAIDDNGKLYTWGNQGYGQLGNGNSDAWQTSPTAITLAQSVKACAVATSSHHQTAIGSDGLLYTWGYGVFSQLGRNGASSSPGTTQPPQITLTKVTFGTMASSTKPATNLTQTSKDTWDENRDWTFVTPAYPYGPSSFTITWNIAGDAGDSTQTQQFDYTFDPTNKRIDLDPVGGIGAAWTSKDIKEGELVPRQTVTKAGFLFDGWFIKASDGSSDVAYDFGKPVTGPLTLVAHWTRSSPMTVNPTISPSTGGYQVTITPPSQRGIRFAQVSTGKNHSLAVGSDGNAYAWGNNGSGQLGNGSNDSSKTPIRVKKPDSVADKDNFSYIQVSAGYGFSLALGSDGNAYAWGGNGSGQLGNGSNDSSKTPIRVKKPDSVADKDNFSYIQVSAGGYHSLAIGTDHQVYAWGDRSRGGQVGDGSTTGNVPTPVAVNASATSPGFQARQVSAGYQHSLIIGISGQTYAWGFGYNGRLGNNSTVSQASPVSVSSPKKYEDGSTGFFATQVSAGGSHSLAISRDGKAYAWGTNTDGRLGTGDTNDAAIPTLVADPDGGSDGFKPTEVSAGGYLCTGIDDKGKVYTWGSNGQNALGNVSITGSISVSPVLVSKDGSTIQITAGERQVLVIDSDGKAYAWGDNSGRQLGTNSDNSSVKAATLVCPPQLTISSVTVGTDPDTVAVLQLTRNGTAETWGSWNTWTFYTPAFKAGSTTVNITWNIGQGSSQTENLDFSYRDVLPLTGSQGLLAILLVGLFVTVTVLASRQHYQETTHQTKASTR
ncbi:RCC1 domain-containing protein [Bifidobacterium sp. ESL0827]|uniref:RCC1 domain-containing protein n=1 Tax=Bifidobacterium sp. ESL0827 TaxID=3448583 RepID=UPI004041A883